MNLGGLLSWQLWEHTRPRKLLTLGLVSLAGPLFAVVLRLRIPAGSYDAATAYGLVVPLAVYSFTLVLLSVVFASSAISSEVVGKTVQYLLTRPVPRWKIILSKWIAATVLVGAAAIVSCGVTALIAFGPAGLADSPLPRDVLILFVGAVTYCAVFTMLSVVLMRPWLVAIGFAFFWETWVPFLPGDFQKLSIMSQLRALLPHPERASAPGDVAEFLAAMQPQTIQPASAWNALILVTIVALAVATLAFMVSEFVPKDEAG